MSKAKKAVLTVVATLALAFIIGATDGLDIRGSVEQASGSTSVDMLKIAAEPEDGSHCC